MKLLSFVKFLLPGKRPGRSGTTVKHPTPAEMEETRREAEYQSTKSRIMAIQNPTPEEKELQNQIRQIEANRVQSQLEAKLHDALKPDSLSTELGNVIHSHLMARRLGLPTPPIPQDLMDRLDARKTSP